MTSSSQKPTHTTPPNPNPNPFIDDGLPLLSRATHLTREELLRRRSCHLKRILKCYKDYYWVLMEDLKVQYRNYYWNYGLSPFERPFCFSSFFSSAVPAPNRSHADPTDDAITNNHVYTAKGIGKNLRVDAPAPTGRDPVVKSVAALNSIGGCAAAGGNAAGKIGVNYGCAFVGCKLKAMALTTFCHLHILSDPKQRLYEACVFVIKRSQAGPILCSKPILRSTVLSYCGLHLQKVRRQVAKASKNNGLNVSSSKKVVPKFHIIIVEYVRRIQAKRRAALKSTAGKIIVNQEGM